MAKKKKNDPSKQAAKAAKRSKVASKAEKTAKRDLRKQGIETEVDLLETLEKYRQQYEEDIKVTVTASAMPTRRANAALCSDPVDTSSLFLFGGEHYDGEACHFYNDLYKYNIDKKEWKQIASPNSPSPRSAHQLVGSSQSGGKLWIFGGEYSSLNQTVFHHFRDLWSFDIQTNSWERFETRIRPSARSGHRMCLFKHYLVLFGGFQDTGIRTTYLSDLWLFDLNEYRWQEIQQDVNAKPRARSGFSFLPCTEGVVLQGGYTKEYINKRAKGLPLDDTWLLRLDKLTGDSGTIASSQIKWERRKRGGYAPSLRSGVTATLWANRATGVLFGGVFDEEHEDSLQSVFYNDLFAYQLSGQGRWRSLNVKEKKLPGGKKRRKQKEATTQKVESDHNHSDSSDQDQDSADSDTENVNAADEKQPEPLLEAKADLPEPPDLTLDRPVERYNAMLAVQRNTLYMYGGILESNAQEATLDDFWSINLDKLDGWNCLQRSQIVWAQEAQSDDDSVPSSASDSGWSDEEEERPEPEEIKQLTHSLGGFAFVEEVDTGPTEAEKAALRKKAEKFLASSKSVSAPTDTEKTEEQKFWTPFPGDNLRIFYERGRDYFTKLAFAHDQGKRGKDLRRDGFQLAEVRFEEYRPILEEVERIVKSAEVEGEANRAESRDLAAESRNRR